MKFLTEQEYKKDRPLDKWVSVCPFCEEHLNTDYSVRSNADWNIVRPVKPSWWPDRWKWHLMLLPRNHHISEITLSPDERFSRAEAELRLEGYFWDLWIDYICFVRLTDPIKSIQHLHYHYIWWNIRYTDINSSLEFHDEKYNIEREN